MIYNEEVITKKMQKKELEMLKELSELLKANEIKFFLSWGTALGCVRHEGFIPWDDDIDLYIFGEDYPKLKRLFRGGAVGNLELHDFESRNDYPYIFPKVVASDTVLKEKELDHLDYTGGVYIDIFPLQGVENNKIQRFVQELIRYTRYGLIRLYYSNFQSKWRNYIAKWARKWINPAKIQRKIYCGMIQKKTCDYVIDPIRFFDYSRIKKSYFHSTVLRKFEGLDMPLPKEYHAYLTQFYGNYMELPPEKDRKSHHYFSTLIIDGVTLIKSKNAFNKNKDHSITFQKTKKCS